MRFLTLLLIILIFCSKFTISAAAGIGDIAENMMEPVSVLSNFIGSASLIVGICALFAAFLRYMQHRVNPLSAPLGSVIMLIIIGIVLLCLPFIYKLTDSGIPFTLS